MISHSTYIQEAAPGSASAMNERCFCSGGWLQLQWLCNFVRTEACPVSFIISSLTEVTARPGLRARLCLDAHVVDSHERQHPAEHRAATRWSLSFCCSRSVYLDSVTQVNFLNNETLLTSALRVLLSPPSWDCIYRDQKPIWFSGFRVDRSDSYREVNLSKVDQGL